MTRGLAIGKFYPPHAGHRHLVETGRARVDRMTVIVCHREGQTIDGTVRAAWLREMCPGVEVLVVPDIVPEDDSRGWADYTRRVLGYAPDVVFTSEEYGERYAGFLGAAHVMVDRERRTVSVSATEIRADPLRHWERLAPCVRAHYARRVCVVGAESTGTTTMARALAAHYRTTWVPEFGRAYWEARMYGPGAPRWETREFVFIATEQNRLEDELARSCNRLLVCDTDALATAIWHERYVGVAAPEVEALSAGRAYALYLLTGLDAPFEQDGTRDGERIRPWMHRRFEEELRRRGQPHLLLEGPHEARLARALAACDGILNAR
jgi:NadR type nicotinamide-nucleotide adenylyltransferase